MISSENIIQEEVQDRDLSTDILDYVLKEENMNEWFNFSHFPVLEWEYIHSPNKLTQRGEEQKDPTLASDILGFVKDKIDSSDLTDISPEILNYVLRERQDQDSDYVTTDASISEDSTEDIIIEGEFL